jgi:ATP-dependent DNA helicase RecG
MHQEPVLVAERIKIGTGLGESHFREFKSALHSVPGQQTARTVRSICLDIAQTLVAFANADGGELYVGVEDDGTITGLSGHSEEDIQKMLAAPRTHVLPSTPLVGVATLRVTIESKSVLFFKVSAGEAHVFQAADGKCLQRRDLESIPISVEHVIRNREEAHSTRYDREFLDGAGVDALDEQLLDIVSQQYMPGIHREKCLQLLDLAEYSDNGLRLKRAALLLFAKEPQKWHPRVQVRILRVRGTELGSGDNYNVTTDEVVSEPILRLIDAVWDRLRPHLVQTRFAPDARFETTYIYPEYACREALVNAIAHRDYSQEGRGIEIYVYDDRMDVVSPGPLLSRITIDDLRKLQGVHQSRNSLVARILKEVGYMRELGEGLRRIFELMRGNELKEPELRNGSDYFAIALHHQQIYSPAEKAWLDQFSALNLDRNQRSVVVLGMGNNLIAPQDIIESLGIVDTEEYRQIISSLQDLGIIKDAVSRSEIYYQMKHKGIPTRRRVPRWQIVLPKETFNRQVRIDEADLPTPSHQRLYVQNLPYHLRETDLLQFFCQFGEVSDLSVPRGYNGTKGYCFVSFVHRKGAAELMNASKGRLEFAGRILTIRLAVPRTNVAMPNQTTPESR